MNTSSSVLRDVAAGLHPRRFLKNSLQLSLNVAIGVGAAVLVGGLALAVNTYLYYFQGLFVGWKAVPIGIAAALILLPVALAAARVFGNLERARARKMLGLAVPEPMPTKPARTGPWGWIGHQLTDTAAWRALLYAALSIPLVVATIAYWWAASLGLLRLVSAATEIAANGPAHVWNHSPAELAIWTGIIAAVIGLAITAKSRPIAATAVLIPLVVGACTFLLPVVTGFSLASASPTFVYTMLPGSVDWATDGESVVWLAVLVTFPAGLALLTALNRFLIERLLGPETSATSCPQSNGWRLAAPYLTRRWCPNSWHVAATGTGWQNYIRSSIPGCTTRAGLVHQWASSG